MAHDKLIIRIYLHRLGFFFFFFFFFFFLSLWQFEIGEIITPQKTIRILDRFTFKFPCCPPFHLRFLRLQFYGWAVQPEPYGEPNNRWTPCPVTDRFFRSLRGATATLS